MLTIRRAAVKTPAHYRPLAPATISGQDFEQSMKGKPMRRTRTAPVLSCTALAAAHPHGGMCADGRWLVYGILHGFGHDLRNEPAPAWITSGVSVLEREQDLTRVSKKGS